MCAEAKSAKPSCPTWSGSQRECAWSLHESFPCAFSCPGMACIVRCQLFCYPTVPLALRLLFQRQCAEKIALVPQLATSVCERSCTFLCANGQREQKFTRLTLRADSRRAGDRECGISSQVSSSRRSACFQTASFP